jgi:hypothetical protein
MTEETHDIPVSRTLGVHGGEYVSDRGPLGAAEVNQASGVMGVEIGLGEFASGRGDEPVGVSGRGVDGSRCETRQSVSSAAGGR